MKDTEKVNKNILLISKVIAYTHNKKFFENRKIKNEYIKELKDVNNNLERLNNSISSFWFFKTPWDILTEKLITSIYLFSFLQFILIIAMILK